MNQINQELIARELASREFDEFIDKTIKTMVYHPSAEANILKKLGDAGDGKIKPEAVFDVDKMKEVTDVNGGVNRYEYEGAGTHKKQATVQYVAFLIPNESFDLTNPGDVHRAEHILEMRKPSQYAGMSGASAKNMFGGGSSSDGGKKKSLLDISKLRF